MNRIVMSLSALGLFGVGMAVAPAVAHADTQPSHFVQTATPSNTAGDYTLINNGATNGNPNAILFVTPNYNAGGVCGCSYDGNPIGVWYDSSAHEWGIFNENGAAMSIGEEFNTVVVPAATTTAFTVTSTSGTVSGDTLYLNSSATNSKPGAIVEVTQNWNPGGVGGTYNNQTPGVWYDGSGWAIFNESGASMATGVSYNVLVGSVAGGKAATLKASTTNTGGDSVFYNNAVTNGDSNDFSLDTPNWNPKGVGGTYDASPTGVWYDGSQLAVFNETGATMANHEAFNMLYWQS
jgi:hypothetical protein